MYTRRLIVPCSNGTEQYVCYNADTGDIAYTQDTATELDWSSAVLNESLLQSGQPVFSAVALFSQYVWLRLFMQSRGVPLLLRTLVDLHNTERTADKPILKDMSRISITKDNAYVYCDRILIQPAYVLSAKWLQDTTNLKHFNYIKNGRWRERPTHKALNDYISAVAEINGDAH